MSDVISKRRIFSEALEPRKSNDFGHFSSFFIIFHGVAGPAEAETDARERGRSEVHERQDPGRELRT